MVMNARERFLEVAQFGKPDRIPLGVGGVRPLTRKAWIKQGLPEGKSVPEYLGFQACTTRSSGIATSPSEGFDWKPSPSGVNIGPSPPFKYRILEADERYRIWVDSLGVTQRGFQEDWKDGWMGFATRVFMDFPVKNRGDFEKIKKRYDSSDPKRYPKNWDEMVKAFRDRDHPLSATIRGPFWWTRDMTGLKKIATGIYREAELIRDIMDFCAEFQTETTGPWTTWTWTTSS
jgi:uroporphyrinogen decarboxylase